MWIFTSSTVETDLFFSRKIGLSDNGVPIPIIGGARLAGKQGRHNVGILDIQTDSAFGRPGDNGEACVLAGNRNPHLAWSGAPKGTQSFALACIDTDVPSKGDDVNKDGRSVPADLPRVDFAHWLMIDVPATCNAIAAGACGCEPRRGRAHRSCAPASDQPASFACARTSAGRAAMRAR